MVHDDFDPMADLERAETALTVRTEKRRYGEPVTIVDGFPADLDTTDVASALKKQMGTGGTVADGRIELQGDHRERVPALLRERGFTVA